MIQILDASALLVYLQKEPGYKKVQDALSNAAESGKRLLMSTVNWGEICYILVRKYQFQKAEEAMRLVDTFPIDLIPADRELAEQAAVYKAVKKLPFADCFAAALTKAHKGQLLTTDKEFKLVESDFDILWI